ncbi:MAG TPA: hypothetical protein VEF04_21225 [Blastocatellia bacterium]|nr:hypothetical protein [Blastocatellia bacterium]
MNTTREHIGAVGEWGVPHCEGCGMPLHLDDIGETRFVMGELWLWECGNPDCPIPDWSGDVWELATDQGLVIAAYHQGSRETEDLWDWLMAGFRKKEKDAVE